MSYTIRVRDTATMDYQTLPPGRYLFVQNGSGPAHLALYQKNEVALLGASAAIPANTPFLLDLPFVADFGCSKSNVCEITSLGESSGVFGFWKVAA